MRSTLELRQLEAEEVYLQSRLDAIKHLIRALKRQRKAKHKPLIYEYSCSYGVTYNDGSYGICGLKCKAASKRAKYCPVHQNVQREAVLRAKEKKEKNNG